MAAAETAPAFCDSTIRSRSKLKSPEILSEAENRLRSSTSAPKGLSRRRSRVSWSSPTAIVISHLIVGETKGHCKLPPAHFSIKFPNFYDAPIPRKSDTVERIQ